MDYINGLEFSQKALSAEQRESIFEELKGCIAQMRALKPTRPGRVESAEGSGLFDTRLGSSPFPSFESIEKFHSHIGHDAILQSDKHRKAWPQSQAMGNRQYCTKFTHSDIAPRNILSTMARSQLSSIGRWLDGIQNIGSILIGQRVIIGLHKGGRTSLLAFEFVSASVNLILVSLSDVVDSVAALYCSRLLMSRTQSSSLPGPGPSP
ncbi:hypothetical protein F5888DRAFT_1683327 [Russula emetica]|nr:hypothetical protein F5888DRAFT_1683327 [Russula emetica]